MFFVEMRENANVSYVSIGGMAASVLKERLLSGGIIMDYVQFFW